MPISPFFVVVDFALGVGQTPLPPPAPPLVHEGEDPYGGGRRHEGRAEEEEEGVGVAEEVVEDVVEDPLFLLTLLVAF